MTLGRFSANMGTMSNGQRKLLADNLANLANIVAGAMVFGQFVTGQSIDVGVVLLGIVFAAMFYIGAYNFAKEI